MRGSRVQDDDAAKTEVGAWTPLLGLLSPDTGMIGHGLDILTHLSTGCDLLNRGMIGARDASGRIQRSPAVLVPCWTPWMRRIDTAG